MKQFYPTTLVCLFFISSLTISFGQISFSQGFGMSSYGTQNVTALAFLYSPRINFLKIGKSTSLSAGTHFGVGYSTTPIPGRKKFIYDIPFMLEMNFGKGAHESVDSGFGFFIGAGYGISKISAIGFTDGTAGNTVKGLITNLGFRFNIAGEEFGLRLSKLFQTNKIFFHGNSNIISLGISYALPTEALGKGESSSISSSKQSSSQN